MTSSTGLIVGLTVGLCVGMMAVVALGLLTGVMIRRNWRLERQKSYERAQANLWQTDPHGSYLEKTYEQPVNDEEQVAHVLYNVPESPYTETIAPDAAVQPENVSPRSVPMPLPSDNDVRFPNAIAEQARRPSIQWTRNKIPEPLQSDTMPSPQSRSASSNFKLSLSRSLSRSRSRMASMRLGNQRNSWTSQRRSMLARLPSHFRSARSSRRVTPNSQEEGSIGMPEREIPMARRIERGQTRFQYDSSSYGSSHEGDWDELATEPEATGIAVPEPVVLAQPREAVDTDRMLQERIAAWQETNVHAVAPSEYNQGLEPYTMVSPKQAAEPLQRSTTVSTMQSHYSHGSEELVNPYIQKEEQAQALVRIPSIRPQFAAETTLESWLGPEDPRETQPSSSGHSSGLFGEVEFATAAGDSASEVNSEARDTLTVPSQRPASMKFGRMSAYAPRTPSPLGMHLAPSQTYAPSASSRSSFPASARMSNDSHRDWKHQSNTTASTELTWAEETSHAADGSPGAALVKLERERSQRSAAADRVARANKAWGVGDDVDTAQQELQRNRVLLPMPGRLSLGSSSASSESVHTEHEEAHATTLATPALGSPLQTIQAWFELDAQEKMDQPGWSEQPAIST